MVMKVLPISLRDFHPIYNKIVDPQAHFSGERDGEQVVYTGYHPDYGNIALFQNGTSDSGTIICSTTVSKVKEEALIRRINRKLKRENEFLVLRKTRSNSRWINDLGDYYLVDELRNTIEAQHINLEDFAREEGVLADNEVLAYLD